MAAAVTNGTTAAAPKKECWTCGGNHEEEDCPHRVYIDRSKTRVGQDKTGELALVRDASNVTGIFSIARSSTVPSCAVPSPTSPHQPAWKPSSHNASPSQNHSRASSMPQYTTIRATVAAAAAAATAAAKIAKAAKGGAQVEDEGPVASAPPPVRRRPPTMAGRRASFCVLDESVEQQLPPRHGHKQCASTSSFFPPPPPLSGSPQALSHLASFRGTASHVIRAEGEPAPMSFSALAMQQSTVPGQQLSSWGPPRTLPAVPPSVRAVFSLDAGWLSLLTLRYLVAQIWALHTVRLACTLIILGIVLEAVRYWRRSVPLLLLVGSVSYLRTMKVTRLAAASDPAGSGGRGPLYLRSRAMALVDRSLKDKNRVKVIVMGLQVLPALSEAYGTIVLFIRVHQHASLPLLVLAYLTLALLLLFLSSPPLTGHTPYPLVRMRVAKLGLQFLCLAFLVGAGENREFFRLVGPALIAIGSSIFLTLSPTDMDGAVRAALTLMLQDVCLYTRHLITDDELLQLATTRWLVEYWSQPTDFSWEDYLPMLQHTLLTLREEMVEAVQPAITSLLKRLEEMNIDTEAVRMVEAAKARVERIAPSKSFTAFLLYYRSTRHVAAFVIIMLVTYLLPVVGIRIIGVSSRPVVPWALLPLVFQDLYMLYTYLPRLLVLAQADSTDADGLSLLLQGTSLLGVWENLRYSVRALEGGLHVVRVYQTSVKALSFIHTMRLFHARAHAQYGALLSQQQLRQAQSKAAEEEGQEGGGTAAPTTTTAAAAATAAAVAERKRRGTEEAVASLTDAWSFAGGWAMMELLRIKASPNAEVASAAGDAAVIYRNAMALYGEWLVHAPGLFNQWLHSFMFTSTRNTLGLGPIRHHHHHHHLPPPLSSSNPPSLPASSSSRRGFAFSYSPSPSAPSSPSSSSPSSPTTQNDRRGLHFPFSHTQGNNSYWADMDGMSYSPPRAEREDSLDELLHRTASLPPSLDAPIGEIAEEEEGEEVGWEGLEGEQLLQQQLHGVLERRASRGDILLRTGQGRRRTRTSSLPLSNAEDEGEASVWERSSVYSHPSLPSPPPSPPSSNRDRDKIEITSVMGLFAESGPTQIHVLPSKSHPSLPPSLPPPLPATGVVKTTDPEEEALLLGSLSPPFCPPSSPSPSNGSSSSSSSLKQRLKGWVSVAGAGALAASTGVFTFRKGKTRGKSAYDEGGEEEEGEGQEEE